MTRDGLIWELKKEQQNTKILKGATEELKEAPKRETQVWVSDRTEEILKERGEAMERREQGQNDRLATYFRKKRKL